MSKSTCVLIHGFTGSPADVAPLGEHLMRLGFHVESPVLCGHCGSKEELRKSTATAWVHSVQPVVQQALQEGDTVHLIGFSLGSMIAGILAGQYPVQSVTMLAPAVDYVGTTQLFKEMAGVIKSAWDKGGSGRDYVRARIDKISGTPLESVKHFRRLVQMGKTALPKVTQPLCVIQGRKDTLVDPKGAEYVLQHVSSKDKELHYLDASGHMLCLDVECAAVNTLVETFLARQQPVSDTPA